MAQCKYNCKNGRVFMESRNGFVDCPECRNITKVLESVDDSGTSFYDKLSIPDGYKSFGVSGQELFNVQGMKDFSQSSILEVSNMLERINRDLYNGLVSNLSCYIYTTNLIDIKRFVYGAQKLALEKGLGVTPYISANTLYGLQKVGDYNVMSLKDVTSSNGELRDIPPDMLNAIDGYRLVQTTNLTYFDFIHTDLCFIEATANTMEKGCAGIADLLGERAKHGRATFVIGYWPTKTGGWRGPKGLRYLLAPESGAVRLDLLVPFEVMSKKSSAGNEASVQRVINVDSSRSSVTAGLSLETFMSGD